MNSLYTKIVRIFLGLLLLIFGLNKFITFIPLPELTGKAGDFMSSLDASGYVLSIVGILEIIIGILLLAKKWVPFALILLAPISINILLFHLFLNVDGAIIAVLIATLNGVLIYKNWPQFKPLFN